METILRVFVYMIITSTQDIHMLLAGFSGN